MDEGLGIPGTRIRFGLDPVLGLVPGIGDALGAIISGVILLEGVRRGVSGFTLARMGVNVALDAILGAVPLIGDLFDLVWKANAKNLSLLERHLAVPHAARRGDRRFLLVVAGALALSAVAAVAGGVAIFLWVMRWVTRL